MIGVWCSLTIATLVLETAVILMETLYRKTAAISQHGSVFSTRFEAVGAVAVSDTLLIMQLCKITKGGWSFKMVIVLRSKEARMWSRDDQQHGGANSLFTVCVLFPSCERK